MTAEARPRANMGWRRKRKGGVVSYVTQSLIFRGHTTQLSYSGFLSRGGRAPKRVKASPPVHFAKKGRGKGEVP